MSFDRIPAGMLDPEGNAEGDSVQIVNGVPAWAPPPAGASALGPSAVITATKTGSATLTETGSMPENVIKVDDTYYLLYSRRVNGSYTRLHIATSSSPAGPWTPSGSNPILTSGSQSWETANITNGACLIYHDGVFYLFYAVDGSSGKIAGIGVATATTVTGPYTKYASNPILAPGAAGAWDERRVAEPDVQLVDGVWVMAFMAESMTGSQGQTEKVGIATASDPFGPWTKDAANPVVGFGAAGAFDEGGAADPSLLYENGLWWMLYSGLKSLGGKPWQLGFAYASTPSGPWTRHGQNPILTVGATGAFDQTAVWRGALYRQGSKYYLNYGGIPASTASYDAKGGTAILTAVGGNDPLAAHETAADPHPQYLTQGEGDARYLTQTTADGRYVRTVNGVAPDGTGDVAVSASTGELLMQDGVTAPPVPLETEGRDDWLYKG